MAYLTLTRSDLVMIRDALAILAPDNDTQHEDKDLLQLYVDCKIDEEEHKCSMCNWLVFVDGDLLGMFVRECDAREFACNYEYEEGSELTIMKAKP